MGSATASGQTRTYRQLIKNKKWHYTGIDIFAGENVDVVLKDGYKFPFEANTFDFIISGQTIEHIEYPWVWFVEMVRVLKKGGLCCIIAPAMCGEHRHPIDCYRYYPDGMRALAKWSGLEVIETNRMVYTIQPSKMYRVVQDTYLIAKKP